MGREGGEREGGRERREREEGEKREGGTEGKRERKSFQMILGDIRKQTNQALENKPINNIHPQSLLCVCPRGHPHPHPPIMTSPGDRLYLDL